MKIGFYHDDLPLPGRKPGGVAVFVHRLARELTSRGHQLTVWTRGPAPADANYRHIRLWPHLRGESRLLRAFGVPLLLNAVDWRDVDILHLHGDDHLMLRRSLPTVRTLYGSAWLEARHATSAKRRVFELIVAAFELLSARLATGCYGLGPGVPAAYRTIGNLDAGVDARAEVTVTRTGAPSILFVGTWEGRKRGRFLHRVFCEQVRPRLPAAELWMVSDHCEAAGGVRCLGALDDRELAQRYRRAWVMCLPSTYEGLGIPYLEAMASGTPILSSPNPGARHVLGPDLAASCMVRDDELGSRLVRLLANQPEREQLAERGLHRVAEFSWDRVVAEHLEAYRRAIADFKGPTTSIAESAGEDE